MRAAFPILLILLTACGEEATNQMRPVEAAGPEGSATSQPGHRVSLTGLASWQVYYLPKQWQDEHLADRDVELAYVLLAPPHREDLDGAYSPCAPPSRIILGVVNATSPPQEHLTRCLSYCGPEDGLDGVYRDLWGAHTQLEGISVQIVEQGLIDVIQHYRERQFVPPGRAEDPVGVDKLVLGSEVRIRHDLIRPEEFRFSGTEAESCAAAAGER